MPKIHPTAIVDSSAELADDVCVGPYTIIEAEVRVGAGTVIGAHATLGKWLRLGNGVQVFNYACLGTRSQDLKHKGERSYAEIGDGAIIREYVTVNRGTREEGVTRVGRGATLMAFSHVAHECEIGEGAVLVNGATLGGEVQVGAFANIGGLVGIHQFCRVGTHAIIGACSKVSQDVMPFLVADGHPARPYGPNVVGLTRQGFSGEDIMAIRRIYREFFNQGRSLDENRSVIGERFSDSPFADVILNFSKESRRGLSRPRSRAGMADEFTFLES